MTDYTILENLFKNEQDEIHFNFFKESNVVKINNNNNFDNGISFNTQSIASKMINYKDAYVLLHIKCEILSMKQIKVKSQFLNFFILKIRLKLLKILRFS